MTPEQKNNVVSVLAIFGIVFSAASGAYLYSKFTEQAVVPVQEVAIESKPAEAVKELPKKTITPKKVSIYHDSSKIRLKLPKIVQDDTTLHVTSATTVEASDNPQTISTVFDEKTGETKTYVKLEPKPWLDVDTRTTIGAYVGYKNGEQVGRLQITQSLLNVKSVNVGLTASFDQPLTGVLRSDYFIGGGLSYRF